MAIFLKAPSYVFIENVSELEGNNIRCRKAKGRVEMKAKPPKPLLCCSSSCLLTQLQAQEGRVTPSFQSSQYSDSTQHIVGVLRYG